MTRIWERVINRGFVLEEYLPSQHITRKEYGGHGEEVGLFVLQGGLSLLGCGLWVLEESMPVIFTTECHHKNTGRLRYQT